jgi:hypothetical protein
MSRPALPLVVLGFLSAILLVLFWESVVRGPVAVRNEPPAPEEDCIGTPIVVPYKYTGGVNDPHACALQCADDQPRYVLYSNGVATQCEEPPGCNDKGEDEGVTCKPPRSTTTRTTPRSK